MSADIIRNGEASIELNTVSRVFDEAAESDERKYIRPVEKKIGKRGLHLREDDHRILESWSSEYFASIPTYEATVAAYYRALQQAMSETGSRVVLSGHGGDNVLLGDGNPFPELSELLMAGRFLTLLRRLRLWTKSSNDSQVRFFWQKLLIRLLPFKLQRAQTRKINKVFRLYESAFVKRMRLRKRFVEPFAMFGVVDPGKKYRRTCFEVAQRQLAADGRHELCGVEFTYPFTHRPLVEFLYSVPIEQLIRPNENKSILRRALRNLVPFELIARQQARITIWPAIDKAARRESSRMRQLFLDAPSSIHDYLNVTAVLEACDQCNEYFDPYVISLVPFEYWLECVENLKSLGVSKQTSRSTRSSGIRFPLAAAASGQISSVEINN
jgi:asparagine synthase (glutamine-hydrolysing)